MTASRHRRVERLAVPLELLEAAGIPGQRAPAAGGAPPGVLGAHLELHHRVLGQRVANALGEHRAAAQGHDSPGRSAQQLEHHLLLTRAEGGLALTVEEGVDRLPQAALQLAVGVERLHPHLGRGRARAAVDLPAPMKPTSTIARPRGRPGRSGVLRYPRLHPIRSS